MAKIAKKPERNPAAAVDFYRSSTKSRALEINRQLQKGEPAFLGNNAWFLEYGKVKFWWDLPHFLDQYQAWI